MGTAQEQGLVHLHMEQGPRTALVDLPEIK
jgi:hypothetical protein